MTEVLASGGTEIPSTVRDVVLARVAQAERVGVRRRRGRRDRAPARSTPALDDSRSAGTLPTRSTSASPPASWSQRTTAVAFRHELARVGRRGDAVADPAPGSPPRGPAGAHRDRPAARRISPASPITRRLPPTPTRCSGTRRRRPRRRRALGAHREAAAQYARALRFAGGLSPGEQATLLERRSDALLPHRRPGRRDRRARAGDRAAPSSGRASIGRPPPGAGSCPI